MANIQIEVDGIRIEAPAELLSEMAAAFRTHIDTFYDDRDRDGDDDPNIIMLEHLEHEILVVLENSPEAMLGDGA
jgi:hypothetical protein